MLSPAVVVRKRDTDDTLVLLPIEIRVCFTSMPRFCTIAAVIVRSLMLSCGNVLCLLCPDNEILLDLACLSLRISPVCV